MGDEKKKLILVGKYFVYVSAATAVPWASFNRERIRANRRFSRARVSQRKDETHLGYDFLPWSELGDEDIVMHRPQPPFPLETLLLLPVRTPLHGTAEGVATESGCRANASRERNESKGGREKKT